MQSDIDSPSEAYDSLLEHQVWNTLRSKGEFDLAGLQLKVLDGTLYLEGTVPSVHQKLRIKRAAHAVKGLSEIVNRLRVAPDMVYRDSTISQAVHSRLARSGLTEQIQVETKGGIVYLWGLVLSDGARRAIESLTRSVPGVSDVVNRLRVADEPSDDEKLAREVRRHLADVLGLSTQALSVRVESGLVYLAGPVPNEVYRTSAEALIRWLPHVRDVVNELYCPPPDLTAELKPPAPLLKLAEHPN